ncbi:MAG: hypothetical protein KBT02_03210 [Treponema sp.]|nr:hypothetical protein [Candidatus Treponema caballi]
MKLKSDRYFVWEEDDHDDLIADNVHVDSAVRGYTELFTKTEFDTYVDQLGESFDNYGIAWELTDTTYEEDTGFYHHTWEWTVRDGKKVSEL